MEIKKTFELTITVDTEKAREVKGGKVDLDAYPNWDINYLGEEERFIDSVIAELVSTGDYIGISVEVSERR